MGTMTTARPKRRIFRASLLRSGVDLIEIERIRKAVDRHGHRFLDRVFTPAELLQCRGRFESLAGRFAVKEAVAKLLGTGVWRDGIAWTDIELEKDPVTGAPSIRLHNAALERAVHLRLSPISISLSHDRTKAIAFAVADESSGESSDESLDENSSDGEDANIGHRPG